MMGTMTTNVTHRSTGVVEGALQLPTESSIDSSIESSIESSIAEQLSLLAPSPLPLQFRLSRATRERGLAHIAAIRKELAERARTSDRARDGEAA
jgi:hypothetical protein